MTMRRVVLSCLMIVLVGAASLVGAVAGGAAVYVAARGQYQAAAATGPATTSPTAGAPAAATLAAATATVPTPLPAPATASDVSANATAPQPTAQAVVVVAPDQSTAIEQAVSKVGPAVVTVINNLDDGSQSSGSGVIISADGYIITNNHVIDQNQSLQVIFADGSQTPAELVGADAYSDIAVLKVSGGVPAVASFGNSDLLKQGETVIAIGSPWATFTIR